MTERLHFHFSFLFFKFYFIFKLYIIVLVLPNIHFHALEKEMATHSSVLAWRIPGTGGAWWAAVYGVAQSRTRLK